MGGVSNQAGWGFPASCPAWGPDPAAAKQSFPGGLSHTPRFQSYRKKHLFRKVPESGLNSSRHNHSTSKHRLFRCLKKHLAWPSRELEPGTENAEDYIIQVMLSDLRNYFSFSFSETEPRHLFLCFGTPCQMLIFNVTFTPHLQGDVYLKCNQGKVSIHQQTASLLLLNPRQRAEVQTL